MKIFELALNGKTYLVEVTKISTGGALVNVNGVEYEVGINDLSVTGRPKEMPQMIAAAEAAPPAAAAHRPQAEAETVGGVTMLRAPLPGLIIDVLVKVGDKVEAGDALLVIETMKMENNVASPRTGAIREVRVSKNETVSEGDPLIVIGG